MILTAVHCVFAIHVKCFQRLTFPPQIIDCWATNQFVYSVTHF